MDEILAKRILEGEKQHKKFLGLYTFGNKLITSAKRVVNPFRDGLRGIPGFCLKVTCCLLLFAVLDFIPILIIYGAYHLIALIVGKILDKTYEKKLYELGEEYRSIQMDYFLGQQKLFGIDNGAVHYDDGVTVASGSVCMRTTRDFGTIKILQLEKMEEQNEYISQKTNPSPYQSLMHDMISSREFNTKYAVIVPKGEERECISYLSPTVQVKMIQSKELAKYSNIFIENQVLSARTGITVNSPNVIDPFSKKRLSKYFDDIVEYCKQIRKMGDTVHADMQKLDFLRGSNI